MVESISQRELRNDSGRIMRGLDDGESYVVTRNGTPVGELTPLRARRFITSRALGEVFRGAPRIEAQAFREDLDALAGQSPAPRA